MRELTPEPKQVILGPRAMMKLNKSRQNLEQSVSVSSPKTPSIVVTAASPMVSQNRRGRKKKGEEEVEQINEIATNKNPIPEDPAELQPSPKKSRLTKEHSFDATTLQSDDTKNDDQKTESNPTKQDNGEENNSPPPTVSQVDLTTSASREETTLKNDTNASGEEKKEITVIACPSISTKVEEEQKDEKDTTPLLLDESIISVPETPPTMTPAAPPVKEKDATFSPEVDTSLHDSRPHIDSVDAILNTTPIHRSKPIRTSTPLAQRLFKRETPKIAAPVLSALSKVLSPKVIHGGKITENSLSDTFNGQFKMGNPLEKSILKSSRRKRSLSVADGESFMQKKVVFMSPEIMDIDSIDVKMMQSFREEKENSILKQNLASGGVKRHRRSLSVSDTPGSKIKPKMPNFKAIHENQFKKMESIFDHAKRKADRALRLATPSKMLPTVIEKEKQTAAHSSKIPTVINRKPLTKVLSRENIPKMSANRAVIRSQSVDAPAKSKISKLPRLNSVAVVAPNKKVVVGIATVIPKPTSFLNNPKVAFNFTSTAAAAASSSHSGPSISQAMRKKTEERRERNVSLYKGNAVKAGHDHRKKAETMIKGVRLNRRFELQMQHRHDNENSDD
jgi:hypothetical protein